MIEHSSPQRSGETLSPTNHRRLIRTVKCQNQRGNIKSDRSRCSKAESTIASGAGCHRIRCHRLNDRESCRALRIHHRLTRPRSSLDARSRVNGASHWDSTNVDRRSRIAQCCPTDKANDQYRRANVAVPLVKAVSLQLA